MNYLEQIVAFHRWKEVNPLPANVIALWYELMATCNKAGWPQEFTVPNAVLQSNAGLSKKEFEKARQQLIGFGLITYKPSSRVNQAGKYSINYFPIVQKGTQEGTQQGTREGIRQGTQEGTPEEHGRVHERGTLYKPKLNENKKENIPYAEIVDYLNEKAGTNFKSSTKATQSHINARWREGFRLEDFKRVIDIKVEDWGNDPRMRPYLRPETLFGTKFESYLNQRPRLTVVPSQHIPTDEDLKREEELDRLVWG